MNVARRTPLNLTSGTRSRRRHNHSTRAYRDADCGAPLDILPDTAAVACAGQVMIGKLARTARSTYRKRSRRCIWDEHGRGACHGWRRLGWVKARFTPQPRKDTAGRRALQVWVWRRSLCRLSNRQRGGLTAICLGEWVSQADDNLGALPGTRCTGPAGPVLHEDAGSHFKPRAQVFLLPREAALLLASHRWNKPRMR